MRDKITRYQPTAADFAPQEVPLCSREAATFVLGAIATRLTVGLTIGMDDIAAERAATRIIAGADAPLDGRIVGDYFVCLWTRLCDQVKSDRAINETGRPPVPHE